MFRLFTVLTLTISFAACKPGEPIPVRSGPDAPINDPDSKGFSSSPSGNASSSSATGGLQGSNPSGSGTSGATNGGTGGGGSAPVPEPGTMLLLGSGLAGFAVLSRRRRRADAVQAG